MQCNTSEYHEDLSGLNCCQVHNVFAVKHQVILQRFKSFGDLQVYRFSSVLYSILELKKKTVLLVFLRCMQSAPILTTFKPHLHCCGTDREIICSQVPTSLLSLIVEHHKFICL